MRAALSAALLLVSAPAFADWTPVQLGPGGPIVEQDWGLYRPGHGSPRLRDGPILMTVPRPMAVPANLRPYFPSGEMPGDRTEPKPASPPKPAEPYFRQWSTPTPPDLAPPPEGPSVIYAPPPDAQSQPPVPPRPQEAGRSDRARVRAR